MTAQRRSEGGFTIVEVVVAVVILSIGVIALVGSSALVTRMVGQGKRTTNAAQIATQRMETLRWQARATTPFCTALAGGSASRPGRITETWTVTNLGTSRQLDVRVIYQQAFRPDTSLLTTIIRCS